MNDSAADKPKLQIAAVTRADYKSGTAFADWQSDTGFAQIGGEFADLLMSSPVREQHDDDPLVLAAMLGNQPIGYINTFNGRLQADEAPIDILWCSGLSVLSEHRSTGAGLMLLLRLRSHPLPSGAVGVSQVALPIYKQLGWHDITADRHLLIMRSAPVLSRWIKNAFLLRLASTVTNAGLWLYRSVLRTVLNIRLSGLLIEEVSALPSDLDPLVRGLDRPLKTHRSVEWVNWAMRTGPK
ncbi:MAG: GNAT family N-acetyltransferase, partial [Gammaproteobacteria bacterium]|nr:GNAT family N-acetyltransferase [Gammaproteobacteria bacterium]